MLISYTLNYCCLCFYNIRKMTESLYYILTKVWICCIKIFYKNRDRFFYLHKSKAFGSVHAYKGIFIFIIKNVYKLVPGFYGMHFTAVTHEGLALGITKIIAFQIFHKEHSFFGTTNISKSTYCIIKIVFIFAFYECYYGRNCSPGFYCRYILKRCFYNIIFFIIRVV